MTRDDDEGSYELRDLTRYPEDDIGDKLYQSMLRGQSSCEPRPIDFAFLFQRRTDADAFAARLVEAGLSPEIEHLPEEAAEAEEWEVLTTRELLADYTTVKRVLDELTALAAANHGKLAFWIP